MSSFWECSKKPDECPYRYDYRGCIKENCPFPYEYSYKDRCLLKEKWKINDNLSGYDFTFIVDNKYFYAKEIYIGYGMGCHTESYEVYKINEEDYNNKLLFSQLTSKEWVNGTGIDIFNDNYYLQFLNI